MPSLVNKTGTEGTQKVAHVGKQKKRIKNVNKMIVEFNKLETTDNQKRVFKAKIKALTEKYNINHLYKF